MAPVIVDPHMHVGEFPLFDVALDEEGLVALFEEFEYEAGIVFHPDNALTRGIVERVPNAWALYWANPRQPGYVEGDVEERELADVHVGIDDHPRSPVSAALPITLSDVRVIANC